VLWCDGVMVLCGSTGDLFAPTFGYCHFALSRSVILG
jgi:hypothetical protein